LDPVGIGIIGCGNISGACLAAARVFPNIVTIRAVADLSSDAAEARGALAFHVSQVMEALQRSSDTGATVAIESRPERPAMLPVDLANGMLD
jgi:predicted dehydrogenase